ncbi:C-terminal binding protein [Halorussus amylolyticus]|uniref:C-terminal binding protein n=1 Tax=Halorussus amylolyticus TaxID=1126242 RepID=UPI00138ED9B6|nr:C-terminal binding protein [Halorussus amylolyticus]
MHSPNERDDGPDETTASETDDATEKATDSPDTDAPTVVISDNKLTDLAVEREVFDGLDVNLVHRELRSIAEIREVAGDAVAVVSDAGTPLAAEAFEGCPDLRVVVRAGIGVDNIAVAAAREQGCVVSNVPDYSVDEVSTHALALLLGLARELPRTAASTAAGEWDWQVGAPLFRLADDTLGVVGCGRIGRRTVAKAAPFFERVVVSDPYVADETIREWGGEPVAFDRLLAESDAVSVHTPLTDETRGLFDREAFDAMEGGENAESGEADESGVIFVNTARGAVVDESALLGALDDGTVRAAGLDVLESEPPESDSLTGRDDVVVTPHVAWYSEESKREVRRKAAEEVRRVLVGERAEYEVEPYGYGE